MYKNSQTANNVFYLTLFNQEAKTTGFGPLKIYVNVYKYTWMHIFNLLCKSEGLHLYDI
jgi:hypothetical protein